MNILCSYFWNIIEYINSVYIHVEGNIFDFVGGKPWQSPNGLAVWYHTRLMKLVQSSFQHNILVAADTLGSLLCAS